MRKRLRNRGIPPKSCFLNGRVTNEKEEWGLPNAPPPWGRGAHKLAERAHVHARVHSYVCMCPSADSLFVYTKFGGCRARLFVAQHHVWKVLRTTALMDMVQATLMLRYNDRCVGHAEWLSKYDNCIAMVTMLVLHILDCAHTWNIPFEFSFSKVILNA